MPYRALIILCIAVLLWVTEKVPPAVTGLFIIVLLPLLGVVDFSHALSGFVDGSVWLLIGVFILAAAMNETGLDKRIAYSLIIRGLSDAKKLVMMSVTTMILLVFVVPSTMGRTALLIPMLAGVVNTMSLGGKNISKVLVLSVTYSSHSIAVSFLTSSAVSVYACSLLEKSIHYSFHYLTWIALIFPGNLLITLLIAPLLLKIFPPEDVSLSAGTDIVRAELEKLGRISRKEVKLIVLICLLFLLWVTNGINHLPLGLSALLIGVLVFMPGISLLEWHIAVKKIDWGSIIIFGSSIGLALALQETGTVDWLAGLAFGVTNKIPLGLLAPATLVFLMLLRIGFGSVLGFATLIFPVVIVTATANHLNPVWLTLVALLGTQLSFFLPSQSPANLPAYATGFIKTSDMLRAGLAVSILYIGVASFMAYFYWPLLHFSP